MHKKIDVIATIWAFSFGPTRTLVGVEEWVILRLLARRSSRTSEWLKREDIRLGMFVKWVGLLWLTFGRSIQVTHP